MPNDSTLQSAPVKSEKDAVNSQSVSKTEDEPKNSAPAQSAWEKNAGSGRAQAWPTAIVVPAERKSDADDDADLSDDETVAEEEVDFRSLIDLP